MVVIILYTCFCILPFFTYINNVHIFQVLINSIYRPYNILVCTCHAVFSHYSIVGFQNTVTDTFIP